MAEKKEKVIKATSSFLQVVLVVLLVAAALAIGSMWTELRILKSGQQKTVTSSPQTQQQPEEITELTKEQWEEVLKDPVFSMGKDDAQVTMVEFTDYQCPFCKRYVDQTFPQIKKDYIDTGKVRYLLKDLTLPFHQNAENAAMAVRCAADQDKAEAMHERVFETQADWGEDTQANDKFVGFAKVLGLNQANFSNCLIKGEKKTEIKADNDLAAKIGATGTPTFYINGKVLVGAQPFSQFKQLIEAALGE